MPRPAPVVFLSSRQREVIERVARSTSEEHRLVERARIILRSANGEYCTDIAHGLGVDSQRVRRWRSRFAAKMGLLASAEEQDVADEDLEALILDVLGDDSKSGGPPKFTAEQFAKLIALACESPKKFGVPVTHWTPGELSRTAKAQGIADISPRHLARFLKRSEDPAAQVALLAQPKDRRPRST